MTMDILILGATSATTNKGDDMRMLAGSNKSKFNAVSKILLGTLALVVVSGLVAVTHAAPDSTTKGLLLGELSLFNPFTLQSTSISATENGGGTEGDLVPILLFGTTSRPPIRIPYRPALRSPFRPPLYFGR